MILYGVGAILFLAVGGVCIEFYESVSKYRSAFRDPGLALGSMCIIDALAFAADVVLTVLTYRSK